MNKIVAIAILSLLISASYSLTQDIETREFKLLAKAEIDTSPGLIDLLQPINQGEIINNKINIQTYKTKTLNSRVSDNFVPQEYKDLGLNHYSKDISVLIEEELNLLKRGDLVYMSQPITLEDISLFKFSISNKTKSLILPAFVYLNHKF